MCALLTTVDTTSVCFEIARPASTSSVSGTLVCSTTPVAEGPPADVGPTSACAKQGKVAPCSKWSGLDTVLQMVRA
jgi:hypothetical protein